MRAFLWILLACVGFISCSNDEENQEMIPASAKGTFTDSRDGNSYGWVRYGNLEWMSENFRYDMKDDSNCQLYLNADDSPVDPMVYGRLYTYSGAVNACPDGWRLPTDDDWKSLEKVFGMSDSEADGREWRGNVAGLMLSMYGEKTDFNILLAGYFTQNTTAQTNGWRHLGSYGFYWTATKEPEKGTFYYYRKFIYNSKSIYRESMEPGNMLSVRYVRDAQ